MRGRDIVRRKLVAILVADIVGYRPPHGHRRNRHAATELKIYLATCSRKPRWICWWPQLPTTSELTGGGAIPAHLATSCMSRSMKLFFPSAQIVVAGAKIGREYSQPDQSAVQHAGRKSQGLHEIDKQYHAWLISFIPCLVLVSVIEYQYAALLPGAKLRSRCGSATFSRGSAPSDRDEAARRHCRGRGAEAGAF